MTDNSTELTFDDPVVIMLRKEMTDKIEEANNLIELIQASNTDFESVLKRIEAEYETEEVNTLQEQIATLEAQLEKLYKVEATRIVNEASETSGNITTAKERATSLKKGIANLTGFLVATYGANSVDGLPTLKNVKGGGNATGRGAGVLRIRGYNWTTDGQSFENLSGAVKVADLDIKEVQEHLIGTYGEDRKSWPQSITAEVSGKTIQGTAKPE